MTQDHRLTRDQLRSLLLGYATAGRVVADPVGALAVARENLRRMRENAAGGATQRWFDEWERLLDGPLLELLAALTSPSPRSRELRQNTPFAGLLSEDERQRVLEEFRRLAAGELSSRFRGLPPVDPRRLREDIDAAVDQRLHPERTATRDEVLAARDELRGLAADHRLTRPRVDAGGAVIVTMPADDPGYRSLARFADQAAAVVGGPVNVVADDAPAASTVTTPL